ncbi:MAG TPA: D-alanyl-D-alanine carboxypeptidase/D-alanyl-D-alanine-endopeptidase, partial [Rhodothermales bacterium]
MRCILAVVACTAFLLPLTPANAQDALERRLRQGIEAAIEAEGFANATWGIEIRDLETGALLYGRNAMKAFVPASTTKLATTAAALEWLGPEHRLETALYADGPIENGVLRGNLVIRGGGDPTISERLEEFGYAGLLEQWADSVAAAGITAIEGDVIGDDDVFDDDDYGPGWQIDDLPYYYSVPVSGLSYNENVIHVEIVGRRRGSPGVVSWEPATTFVNVRNQTMTISRDSIIA